MAFRCVSPSQVQSQQCCPCGGCMGSSSVLRASFGTGPGLAMALGTDPSQGLQAFQTWSWTGMLLETASQMTQRQDPALLCGVCLCLYVCVSVCVCVCLSVCLCCNLCLLSAAHPCSYCILLPYTACLLVSCLLPLSAVCCLFTSCCLHLHALLLPLCFCLLVRPFLSVLFAFYCLALLPFGQLPFAYLYCLLPRATSSCCLSVTRLLSFCNLCCQL